MYAVQDCADDVTFVGSWERCYAAYEFLKHWLLLLCVQEHGQLAVRRVELVSSRNAHSTCAWYIEMATSIMINSWSTIPCVNVMGSP